MVLFMSLVMPAAVFFGNPPNKRDGVVALLFLVPFLLVGVICLLIVFHRGRRSTALAVAGDQLLLLQSGLFGTRKRECAAANFAGGRVFREYNAMQDGSSWTTE